MSRIGVIGLGAIGRAVAEYAQMRPEHSLAFARNRSRSHDEWSSRTGIEVGIGEPTDQEIQAADLVVEAAHPEVIGKHGQRILEHCDLLVVSVGALADVELLAALTNCANRAGTGLIIPRGALVGMDGLLAQRWSEATITMVKSPQHLDPPLKDIEQLTVLHNGPVRALATRFPRNVNAMVAFALATRGIDETMTKLVCDPAVELGHLHMELSAEDGTSLRISKSQPMIGVSGTEMTTSILRTLDVITASSEPGLRFA